MCHPIIATQHLLCLVPETFWAICGLALCNLRADNYHHSRVIVKASLWHLQVTLASKTTLQVCHYTGRVCLSFMAPVNHCFPFLYTCYACIVSASIVARIAKKCLDISGIYIISPDASQFYFRTGSKSSQARQIHAVNDGHTGETQLQGSDLTHV